MDMQRAAFCVTGIVVVPVKRLIPNYSVTFIDFPDTEANSKL